MILFCLIDCAFVEGIAYPYDEVGNRISRHAATRSGPIIVSQPGMQMVQPNGSAGFSVVVADASVSYQWRFNGANISGAMGDSLSLAKVTAANQGSYDVVVTNAIGSATSTAASLWVDVDGNGVGDGWETSVLAWGLESADSQQTVPVNLEKAVAIVAGNGFSVVL